MMPITAPILALLLSISATQEPPKLEDTPKLYVTGTASIDKPADQVRISVGVVTEDENASEAIAANNELMHDVVRALEKAGLSEDEYETSQFRIRPRYSRRPRNAEPDWQPTIVGYDVTNVVVVTTQQIDNCGEIIAAADKAGANTVNIDAFELADSRKYRGEAIREATKNAINDAKDLAAAAGLSLVRVVSIRLDGGPMVASDATMMRAARAGAESAPPINPGDVTVRASVSVVYEIAEEE